MTYKEAYNGVLNTIGWLDPLIYLRDALKGAVDAEAYLASVGPRLESLKSQEAEARAALGLLRGMVADEEYRLHQLGEEGSREVEAVIARVRDQHQAELYAFTAQKDAQIASGQRTLAYLDSQVAACRDELSRLNTQTDEARVTLASVRGELDKVLASVGTLTGASHG